MTDPGPFVVSDSAHPRLELDLTVAVVRRPRSRCPRCGKRRILFALAAFTPTDVVGSKSAVCGPCGGLR